MHNPVNSYAEYQENKREEAMIDDGSFGYRIINAAWKKTPWWHWRSWGLKQVWRRHYAEIYDPDYKYQTEIERAREGLEEQFGVRYRPEGF